MRVAVMGAGAVGAYFGGLLALAGHTVSFVARGAHLEALQQHGLQVYSRHGDFHLPPGSAPAPGRTHAVGSTAEVGAVDLVLFAVKSQDTDRAAADLFPLLHEQTLVLTVQNGVDNPARIAREVGAQRVLAGICQIEAFIERPGVVRNPSAMRDIAFGEFAQPTGARGREVGAMLQAAGIPTRVADDYRLPLWQKFIFLCTFSAFTTATRLPIGDLRQCPQSWELYGQMLRELYAVGLAEGVPLDPMTPELAQRVAHGLDPAMKSSMLRDLEAAKALEVEYLQGAAVRLAARNGVPVPVSQTLYGLLKVIDPGRQ